MKSSSTPTSASSSSNPCKPLSSQVLLNSRFESHSISTSTSIPPLLFPTPTPPHNHFIKNFLKSRKAHPTSSSSSSPPRSHFHHLFNKIKQRISSNSTLHHQKPITWDHYLDAYSRGELDVENPPLPPLSAQLDPNGPFQAKFFPAPLPHSEASRQTVLNRLGYYEAFSTPLNQHHSSPTSSSFSSVDVASPPNPFNSNSNSTPSQLGPLQSLHLPSSSSLPPLSTLFEHPAFYRITNRCVSFFSATASMVSLIDDDRLVLLAETGYPGLASVHRDLSFCPHAILNGDRPFAVLDTTLDWRFANHPHVLQGAVRSYIGAPIFAPHLPGLIHPRPANPVCIGSLCVIDVQPRTGFSQVQRDQLVQLASQCSEIISDWFLKKLERKIDRLNNITLSNWLPPFSKPNRNQLPSSPSPRPKKKLSVVSSSTFIASNPKKSTSPRSLDDGDQTLSFVAHISFPRKRLERFKQLTSHHPPTTPLENPTTPFPFLSSQRAAKFDLATKILAETLELSTVYLVAVMPPSYLPSNLVEKQKSCPPTPSKTNSHILIISSHNVPIPAPPLDYELHRKAIRNGSEGLIFQLPPPRPPNRPKSRPNSLLVQHQREADWQEVQDFAFDRAYDEKLRATRRRLSAASANPNRSGILLRIGPERQMLNLSFSCLPSPPGHLQSSYPQVSLSTLPVSPSGGSVDGAPLGGFVLAGYSHDPKRVIGLEDMAYFKQFSSQLVKDIDELFRMHS